MLCNACGQENPAGTKYCRKCGAGLVEISEVKETHSPAPGVEREVELTKERVARALLSRLERFDPQEAPKSALGKIFGEDPAEEIEEVVKAVERLLETDEDRRLRRIRAGVILSSVGFASSLFLSFLFDGVANFVQGPPHILIEQLWGIGLIPLFLGLGFIINGLLLTRPRVARREARAPGIAPGGLHGVRGQLEDPLTAPASVTEQTTTPLNVSAGTPRP